MKNKEQLQLLYQKYLNNQLAQAEIKKLLNSIEDISTDELSNMTAKVWDMSLVELKQHPEEKDRLKRILFRIKRDHIKQKAVPPFPIKWIYRTGIAASIVLVLSVGFYFYHKTSVKIAFSQVQPGKDKAILTLSDGTNIDLSEVSNGEVAKQQGVLISKSGKGQLLYQELSRDGNQEIKSYNTISTPRGGKYRVVLADNTTVWLNAASSLKYPAQFNGAVRNVELTGEAYFEVAKDRGHPFVVTVAGQQVKVLGTHFNINAYTDEQVINTTLLEGSIEIITGGESKKVLPGEQAVTRVGMNTIAISKTEDTESAIAWKNNVFYFNEASTEVIMRQVSRWYNVEINYSGAIPKGVFSGKMSRSSSLSELIARLSYAGLNCDFKNGKLNVKPNN